MLKKNHFVRYFVSPTISSFNFLSSERKLKNIHKHTRTMGEAKSAINL